MKSQTVLLSIILYLFCFQQLIFAGQPVLREAPKNPEYLEYMRQNRGNINSCKAPVTGEHALGYVPTVMDFSYLKGRGKEIMEPELMKNAASLPSSYDLRRTGRITSVKDQGTCGSCWAFAAYGSLESYLKLSGTYDFSEQNMNQCHGFNNKECAGGDSAMATAYLARWSGPLLETNFPYPYGGSTQSLSENDIVHKAVNGSFYGYQDIESISGDLSPQFHVQNVFWIPDRANFRDNDLVKASVMTYGAVVVAFNWSASKYNTKTHAYYNSANVNTNHLACIAGWDDNYPKKNFKTQPPGNGAFIVKNSWGTGWGENGYFYMSYYDASLWIGTSFNNAESSNNYKCCYEYDPLGLVNSYGYGTDTAYMADIFMAGSSNVIRAVSIYANSPNTLYHIWIYKNPDPDNPVSGTLVKTYTGTINLPGYNTISFGSSPAVVTSQQSFSVVVEVKTPGNNFPIPMCYRLTNYSSAANGNTGQSFISPDGTTWTDASTVFTCGHACIKAFAN